MLQPLIVLPYLAGVLGPERLGVYAYLLSLAALASVIIDYGFGWTGQQAAARLREDPDELGSLTAQVITAKALLCLFVACLGLFALQAGLLADSTTLLCVMLSPIGGALFPVWLFLGIERPWRVTIPVVVARAFALIVTLVTVTSSTQVQLAVAIQASVPLVSAVVSVPFFLRSSIRGLRSLQFPHVLNLLRTGFAPFVSSLAINAVVILPVPIVSLAAGEAAVGYYTIADRFLTAFRALFRVLSQTLMPRVAYESTRDRLTGILLVWRCFATVPFALMLSVLTYVAGPYVVATLFGSSFLPAAQLLRSMALIPILMNLVLCTFSLYVFNFKDVKVWTTLSLSRVALFLAFVAALSGKIGAPLAVIAAITAAEAFVVSVSGALLLVDSWRLHRAHRK